MHGQLYERMCTLVLLFAQTMKSLLSKHSLIFICTLYQIEKQLITKNKLDFVEETQIQKTLFHKTGINLNLFLEFFSFICFCCIFSKFFLKRILYHDLLRESVLLLHHPAKFFQKFLLFIRSGFQTRIIFYYARLMFHHQLVFAGEFH